MTKMEKTVNFFFFVGKENLRNVGDSIKHSKYTRHSDTSTPALGKGREKDHKCVVILTTKRVQSQPGLCYLNIKKKKKNQIL